MVREVVLDIFTGQLKATKNLVIQMTAQLNFILLILLATTLSGRSDSSQSHERPLKLVFPQSNFIGYDEKTEKSIEVRVAGAILHQGSYHLPEQSSLHDLLLRIGECAPNLEWRPMYRVILNCTSSDPNVVHYMGGGKTPNTLLSGDHGAIAQWREEQALALTRKNRPDLLE